MMYDKYACRVMILDDEPFMLKLLSQLLARLGIPRVDAVDSGVKALQAIDNTETTPQLILLDLNMPEMDGIEFIRKLVERDYSGALVLVSGEDERIMQLVEKLAVGRKFSVLGHLPKPVRPKDLDLLLDAWEPPSNENKEGPARKTYDADTLRAAIAKGELINFYQPKVAVTTGQAVGVEALVRWRHPDHGMVYPDQFIDLAESHQMIDAVTLAVLTTGLRDINFWRQAGLSLRVAINVSMENLVLLDFPDRVARLAADAGVAAYDLMLEVTESRLMRDLRAVLDILSRLRLKRFDLAIDDFGTGHSSLVQLRDLPFTQLKIDQSFVRGAHADKTAQALYTASLKMAKELNMEVVAEGVETREDWEYLRRTGCDVAQGYFIAKPMPADALPDWITHWQHRVSSNFDNESAEDRSDK